MGKVAVLIPAYRRPEYTKMCLDSVERAQDYSNDVTFYLVDDGSADGTSHIMSEAKLNSVVTVRKFNEGLRNTIIDFFEEVLNDDYTYITKIDNDCIVPPNWLNDLMSIIEEADADILSPNVSETNAAYKYGSIHKRKGPFIPSKIVGGLWFMRRSMIEDIYFERANIRGIYAAFNIIRQIVLEKEPRIGWTDAVTYEDVGHAHGTHPKHIKTGEHAAYSKEIGRAIKWRPNASYVQS